VTEENRSMVLASVMNKENVDKTAVLGRGNIVMFNNWFSEDCC